MSSAVLKKLGPYYHGFRAWASGYPALYAGLSRVRRLFKYTYPESALAHRYLDGLRGIDQVCSAIATAARSWAARTAARGGR